MKCYHYYVTFVIMNNLETAFGSTEYTTDSKIDTFEAIHSMRYYIEALLNRTNICILDYKLIRDEPY